MTNLCQRKKCKPGKFLTLLKLRFILILFLLLYILIFRFVAAIEAMLEKDMSDNRSIGEFGAKAILSNVTDGEQVRILTHCNTGSLATVYFGTALGVVRCLHSASRLGKIIKRIYFVN